MRAPTGAPPTIRPSSTRASPATPPRSTSIVERYQRQVYQLCYRFVGNHEDASDLAQDVFVRAYRGLRGFRGAVGARHLALSHRGERQPQSRWRSRRRAPRRSINASIADTAIELPDAALLRAERAAEVRAAVARLPRKQRATLILRVYHELPHQEIADILGSSVGAVKANFFHALANLKKLLAMSHLSHRRIRRRCSTACCRRRTRGALRDVRGVPDRGGRPDRGSRASALRLATCPNPRRSSGSTLSARVRAGPSRRRVAHTWRRARVVARVRRGRPAWRRSVLVAARVAIACVPRHAPNPHLRQAPAASRTVVAPIAGSGRRSRQRQAWAVVRTVADESAEDAAQDAGIAPRP